MKLLKSIFLFCCLINATVIAQTSVQIPNVFTPDNDGVNDIFRISTAGYDALTCTIYNRHGEVVYIFHGLNGSWDAFSHAGVKVSAGTYFVMLDLTLPDGTIENKHTTLQVCY
jgi:gliding motility-associated-like protein